VDTVPDSIEWVCCFRTVPPELRSKRGSSQVLKGATEEDPPSVRSDMLADIADWRTFLFREEDCVTTLREHG